MTFQILFTFVNKFHEDRIPSIGHFKRKLYQQKHFILQLELKVSPLSFTYAYRQPSLYVASCRAFVFTKLARQTWEIIRESFQDSQLSTDMQCESAASLLQKICAHLYHLLNVSRIDADRLSQQLKDRKRKKRNIAKKSMGWQHPRMKTSLFRAQTLGTGPSVVTEATPSFSPWPVHFSSWD